MGKKISLLDTTLRDGAQTEGVSFSVLDRLQIIRQLSSLGLDYIEAGVPLTGGIDGEIFRVAAGEPALAAFGSTRRKDKKVNTDAGLAALLSSGAPTIVIVGKTCPSQIKTVLKTSNNINLKMIEESVSYLKSAGRKVIYDAENFFNAYLEDKEYAVTCLRAAENGGADIITLCDTNGSSLPDFIAEVTEEIDGLISPEIGIHCHDDMGLATANTLAAVEAGATHIQGTLNGIGERCGNASLSALIPTLQLKLNYNLIPEENLLLLYDICAEVARITGIALPNNSPYTGSSAFAHKSGLHTDAMLKDRKTFEHIEPSLVGNKRKILMSGIGGKSALLHAISRHFSLDKIQIKLLLEKLKSKEKAGYQYEGADASLLLDVKKILGEYLPAFEIIGYKSVSDYPASPKSASVTVAVKVRDEVIEHTETGEGPVHAMDKALRKALTKFYPVIADVSLTDYTVRVLNSEKDTAANVRVNITSTDGNNTWTTVGVSPNIIDASAKALRDSIEYKLLQ